MAKSMIDSLVNPVVRTVGKAFKGPMGKVAGVGFTAVAGAVAEDFARKSGIVDTVSGLALDVLGLDTKKVVEEVAAPPPAAEPPHEHEHAPVGGVEIGCAGGECAAKKPCAPCQAKAALAGFVAAAKKLPEYQGLLIEAKKAKIDLQGAVPYPPFWIPDPPAPNAPPSDSTNIKVTTADGYSLTFTSMADYKAWQRAQKAAQEQKNAAQRALAAKTKADQAQINALKKRNQDQATQARIAALQAQVDQQKALNAQLQATPPQQAAPAAQQVVSTAAQGGDMSSVINQIMQLKMLESVMSPGQQPQQQMTPWDGQAYYDGGQSMYAQPGMQMDPSGMDEDALVRYSLGPDGQFISGASEDELVSMFATRGVAEDYEALQEQAALTDMSSQELEDLTSPNDLLPGGIPEGEENFVLDPELDCESCNQVW